MIGLELTEMMEKVKAGKGKLNLLAIIASEAKSRTQELINSLLKSEITISLGRKNYERQEGSKQNYRNGYHKQRSFLIKGIGKIKIKVPRDRIGSFESKIIPKKQQDDGTFGDVLQEMFLAGISTRKVGDVTQKILGRNYSASEVSKAVKTMTSEMEAWRDRRLDWKTYVYLYCDGVNFKIRRDKKDIFKESVLAVIGVASDGTKDVLGFQAGNKETAEHWKSFFSSLIQRGIKFRDVQLGIMDGLPGLEEAFKDKFPNAVIQRCQVHKAKNVLQKINKKDKSNVAADMRKVFYASSKTRAKTAMRDFETKWEIKYPSATKCLRKDINSCLRFYDFPQQHWLSIRTTNPIERLNKEYKRRTKVMEILNGEQCLYRILFYISKRMEKYWKKHKIGAGIELHTHNKNKGIRNLSDDSGEFTQVA